MEIVKIPLLEEFTGFFSFARPVQLFVLHAHCIEAFRINRVITSAVNMETTIPRASVCAKPLTVPEPMKPSTAAAISVVIFPSRIAESAFWKPIFIEDFTVLPVAISLTDTSENNSVGIYRHTDRQG